MKISRSEGKDPLEASHVFEGFRDGNEGENLCLSRELWYFGATTWTEAAATRICNGHAEFA